MLSLATLLPATAACLVTATASPATSLLPASLLLAAVLALASTHWPAVCCFSLACCFARPVQRFRSSYSCAAALLLLSGLLWCVQGLLHDLDRPTAVTPSALRSLAYSGVCKAFSTVGSSDCLQCSCSVLLWLLAVVSSLLLSCSAVLLRHSSCSYASLCHRQLPTCHPVQHCHHWMSIA